jgi:hypothetical protein
VFEDVRVGAVAAQWAQIDRVILLTVIAAIGHLNRGVSRQTSRMRAFKCFQLFGFDILLDQELAPHLLEVNYRPSLGSDSATEQELKRQMLIDLCHLVVERGEAPGLAESRERWAAFFEEKGASSAFKKVDVESTDDRHAIVKILKASRNVPLDFDARGGRNRPRAKTPDRLVCALRRPSHPRSPRSSRTERRLV